MQIHNIRLGLATNSSSTHSLIFLPGAGRDILCGGQEFGWEEFQATSSGAKLGYLAQIVASNLRGAGLGDDLVGLVTKELAGVPVDRDGYVDHQSVWELPRPWLGVGVDTEFLAALRTFLLAENVAILGGNDNGPDGRPPGAFQLPLERDSDKSHWVARRDREVWVLFNRKTGAKIRFSFDSPDQPAAARKSTYPELVDVKLTDACPFGCSYCYQGSTPGGGGASFSDVSRLASILGRWRVFEVALGGGEPTLHPEFLSALRLFRKEGVVPNFTTRNLSWLRDDAMRHEVLAQAGAFAFSVDKEVEVGRLVRELDYHRVDHDRAAVQVVVGPVGKFELGDIVRACGKHRLRLVLLGYKTTGRGSTQAPEKYDWIKVVQEATKDRYCRIGIDTALAQEARDRMPNEMDKFVTYDEGKFSMYVDLPGKRCGPSSYCEEREYVPLGKDWEETIETAYRRW